MLPFEESIKKSTYYDTTDKYINKKNIKDDIFIDVLKSEVFLKKISEFDIIIISLKKMKYFKKIIKKLKKLCK